MRSLHHDDMRTPQDRYQLTSLRRELAASSRSGALQLAALIVAGAAALSGTLFALWWLFIQ